MRLQGLKECRVEGRVCVCVCVCVWDPVFEYLSYMGVPYCQDCCLQATEINPVDFSWTQRFYWKTIRVDSISKRLKKQVWKIGGNWGSPRTMAAPLQWCWPGMSSNKKPPTSFHRSPGSVCNQSSLSHMSVPDPTTAGSKKIWSPQVLYLEISTTSHQDTMGYPPLNQDASRRVLLTRW